MQTNKENKKITDFISFLKRNWHFSDVLFQEKNLAESIIGDVEKAKASAEEKVKRFYRSLEEGKLAKVLNYVVDDEPGSADDRDDASVEYWKNEKEKSEKAILAENVNTKTRTERVRKILTNPINHSLLHGLDLNKKDRSFSPGFSFAWKFATATVAMLFISIAYVGLYPERSQESVDRLDLVMTYPTIKTVEVARYIHILPELEYVDRFANTLPESLPAINSDVKSDYIKNLNSRGEMADASGRIDVTEDDLRKLRPNLVKYDSQVVVLGIDSDAKEPGENKLVRSIKNFLKNIAEKQEQLSLDMNDKLIEMISN